MEAFLHLLMNGLLALLGFGFVIFIHELGHLVAALFTKTRVWEFSIGFGKALAKVTIKGLPFYIRAVPFGGYVVLEKHVDPVQNEILEKDPQFLYNRPPLVRFIILVAGCVFNFVSAFILYYIFYAMPVINEPRVMVAAISKDSVADQVGIMPSDIIVSINGTQPKSSQEVVDLIQLYRDNLELELLRNGHKKHIATSLPTDEPYLGVMTMSNADKPVLTSSEAIAASSETVLALPAITAGAIKSMVSGQEKGDVKISPRDLMGPIGIMMQLYQMSIMGIEMFIMVIAFFSAVVGVFNLLPIPALDGGRILMLGLRCLGMKMSIATEELIHNRFLIFFLVLMCLILINDFIRILS